MEIEEPNSIDKILEDEIKERGFGISKEVLAQCRRIIQNNLISIDDLMLEIEVRLYNEKNESNQITPSMITQISEELRKKQEINIKKIVTQVPKVKSNFITPEKQKNPGVFNSGSKSAKDMQFENNIEKGEKTEIFNPNLPKPDPKHLSYTKLTPEIIENYEDFPNYLNSTIKSKGEALRKRFTKMKKHYEDYLKIIDPNFKEFATLGEPILNDSFVVARILLDAAEGKINEESMILDHPDLNTKVSLSLDIKNYFFFSSQIVALYGNTNEDGKKFYAKQLFDETVISKPDDLTAPKLKINPTKYAKIVVAAGPFTTDDSINFTPLVELGKELKIRRPDALILMGPFISMAHPVFQSGSIVCRDKFMTYETFFLEILNSLELELGELSDLKIFIIPSPDDIFHSYPLPQIPFKLIKDDAKLSSRFIFLSNPSAIQINEASIKFFNSSLIFDMNCDSLFKPGGGDRFEAISRQIYHQRNLVPIHPLKTNSIDLRKLEMFNIELPGAEDENNSSFPDIVILPSKMGFFARRIQNTIFFNPGLLCKDDIGSFGEIIIYSDETSSCVYERTKINLISI